jgi:hypothetical protein
MNYYQDIEIVECNHKKINIVLVFIIIALLAFSSYTVYYLKALDRENQDMTSYVLQTDELRYNALQTEFDRLSTATQQNLNDVKKEVNKKAKSGPPGKPGKDGVDGKSITTQPEIVVVEPLQDHNGKSKMITCLDQNVKHCKTTFGD